MGALEVRTFTSEISRCASCRSFPGSRSSPLQRLGVICPRNMSTSRSSQRITAPIDLPTICVLVSAYAIEYGVSLKKPGERIPACGPPSILLSGYGKSSFLKKIGAAYKQNPVHPICLPGLRQVVFRPHIKKPRKIPMTEDRSRCRVRHQHHLLCPLHPPAVVPRPGHRPPAHQPVHSFSHAAR